MYHDSAIIQVSTAPRAARARIFFKDVPSFFYRRHFDCDAHHAAIFAYGQPAINIHGIVDDDDIVATRRLASTQTFL